MVLHDEQYEAYIQILKEELIPAFGCTEPIALAYAASIARQELWNQRKGNRGMNGYAHVFIVFCPIEAGYNDTRTNEDTAEQSHQQEDNTS